MLWNPSQYGRFASKRLRPYLDLIERIGASDPERVLDVGSGPGNATLELTRRWPDAKVEGIDAAPEMIASAQALASDRLSFRVSDAHDAPVEDADVVTSNAVLQWIPDHRELLDSWMQRMKPGSWLAFQVPGSQDLDSHRLPRELAAAGPWAERVAGLGTRPDAVDSPAAYTARILAAGWEADVWETTYMQLLTGKDAVLEWVKGSSLAPILQALEPEEAAEFEADLAARLRESYPSVETPSGSVTPYPFRRIFAVAHRPE